MTHDRNKHVQERDLDEESDTKEDYPEKGRIFSREVISPVFTLTRYVGEEERIDEVIINCLWEYSRGGCSIFI